ncbi:MAG: beta-galactosidase, partial [Bacteroidaceae bacterium]|nr:beta-galactosidase [Bacteroidaceae bacterium]
MTSWGENLDKENVWNVYPRPIMERGEWINLNGEWNYAVTSLQSATPSQYEGEILVPFAIESQLSGVERRLSENDALWYQRTFTLPASWRSRRVLLHFGAVDWQADVWVNGVKVGRHTGGYTPFSFDITAALRKGENNLEVRVVDTTDKGYQPRGKQVSNPGGIWYTPVSGIWQTVWLEPVA